MQQEWYIGVDIGTTSTKSVMYTNQGRVIAKHAVEYPLQTPEVSAAEQNPEVIFQAVLVCIRITIEKAQINQIKIGFVSFGSAMHSLIAVDEKGTPLTQCITWADNRSAKWADQLRKDPRGHAIYRRTGTPIHPMSPLVKLMWLKHRHTTLFENVHKFISIKEYVFNKLFGEYIVDYSIASATGLLDLEKLDWDDEALEIAGISATQLSKLVPTTKEVSGLSETYAKHMGIDSTTPFIIGASDGVLSNLGINAIEPGVIAVTIGTSGAIRTAANKPVTDPKGRTFCYALTEDIWIVGGPVNNGGLIFQWVKDELCAFEVEAANRLGMDPYDFLTEIAANVNPGADGLLFHPYLSGERAPMWNANARGSFFGLALHHQKKHLIRAVLEGVIFNLYLVMLAIEELVGIPNRIQATGGFGQSLIWRQMLADILNQEVTVPTSYESSCLGAVVLGMYGQNKIKSLQHVSTMVGSVHSHTPNREHVMRYHELIPIYIRLSKRMEKEYEAISSFQNKYVQLD